MTGWVPRVDGGRPEGRSCPHGPAPEEAGPQLGDGCAACRARGRAWVRLRVCLTCGHVGCCDSSPGGHATAHHEATGHPVARSGEPDESWAWCYACELYLQPAETTPDTARRAAAGGG